MCDCVCMYTCVSACAPARMGVGVSDYVYVCVLVHSQVSSVTRSAYKSEVQTDDFQLKDYLVINSRLRKMILELNLSLYKLITKYAMLKCKLQFNRTQVTQFLLLSCLKFRLLPICTLDLNVGACDAPPYSQSTWEGEPPEPLSFGTFGAPIPERCQKCLIVSRFSNRYYTPGPTYYNMNDIMCVDLDIMICMLCV